jgi:hypothetical protein
MPNRDGTGPMGDGRLGRGLGNCRTPRRSERSIRGVNDSNHSGFANSGIELLVDAIKYLINRKNSSNRR